jgi:hypothetical protein
MIKRFIYLPKRTFAYTNYLSGYFSQKSIGVYVYPEKKKQLTENSHKFVNKNSPVNLGI